MNRKQLFDKIFPQTMIRRLEEAGEEYASACWKIGKYTQIAIEHLRRLKSALVSGETRLSVELDAYVMAFGVMDVYKMVALYTGLAERTVRDYHSVVVFYSPDVIERFDMLPFSHFRFAKTQGELYAVKILALSQRQMDFNGGRPPSVAWLEVNFGTVIQTETGVNQVEGHNEQIVIAQQHAEIQEQADKINPVVRYFSSGINRLINQFSAGIAEMELSPERQKAVNESLETLQAVIEDLQNLLFDRANG